MDKAEVIEEIRRLTAENGDVPVGQTRFFAETGIRPHEVIGKLWSKWGDALTEAGFEANAWNGPKDEDVLLAQYVGLIRKLGKWPTNRDIGVEQATHPGFPAATTLKRRFGAQSERAARIRSWCETHPGNDDVLALIPEQQMAKQSVETAAGPDQTELGFVYLLKSGRHYKIGRSNDAGRRGYEIRLQQPEPVEEVWKIKTDDPEGIERYWHRRFADRRLNGEWFDLRKAEVDAFKRWRRIT